MVFPGVSTVLAPNRRPDTRAGAMAAELAIVLPFVLLLFAVAVDFCRLYYQTQTVQNCACTGALYASGNARSIAAPTGSGGTVQISATTGGQATDPDSTQGRTDAAKRAAVAEGVSLSPALTTDNVQVAFAGGSATVTV